MGRLEGKVVVITGGNSGVGAATAKLFAQEGAIVVISARRAQALAEVEVEIKANGGTVLSIPTDISKVEDCDNLIETTVATFGKIDVLVNNAGIIKRIPMTETKVEEFKQVINVDLVAPFICAKAVIPSMIKKGGGYLITLTEGYNVIPDYAFSE